MKGCFTHCYKSNFFGSNMQIDEKLEKESILIFVLKLTIFSGKKVPNNCIFSHKLDKNDDYNFDLTKKL